MRSERGRELQRAAADAIAESQVLTALTRELVAESRRLRAEYEQLTRDLRAPLGRPRPFQRAP